MALNDNVVLSTLEQKYAEYKKVKSALDNLTLKMTDIVAEIQNHADYTANASASEKTDLTLYKDSVASYDTTKNA